MPPAWLAAGKTSVLWQKNHLAICLQPNEQISLCCQAKHPGSSFLLSPVDMHFSYPEMFKAASPEAYETLLVDVIAGDETLFMRADQIEEAWSVITPILSAWAESLPVDFPNYQAGFWGPEAADVLIAQDGRSWFRPNIQQRIESCFDLLFWTASNRDSWQCFDLALVYFQKNSVIQVMIDHPNWNSHIFLAP